MLNNIGIHFVVNTSFPGLKPANQFESSPVWHIHFIAIGEQASADVPWYGFKKENTNGYNVRPDQKTGGISMSYAKYIVRTGQVD